MTSEKTAETYVVVVTCFVISGEDKNYRRVLIIKRPDDEPEGPGLWTIPGGKIEPDDWKKVKNSAISYEGAFKSACRRELLEETGLVSDEFKLLSGLERMFFRQSGVPTLVLAFRTSR